MSCHIPAHMARRVRKRAGDHCEYCRLSQQWQEATFHVDHVKPRSLGGETALNNLALACVSCSLRKSARAVARDPKTSKAVRLFNPRRDEWDDHFLLLPSFRIRGLTARGRATINALRMNCRVIVAIRREISSM
jgi:hypothetical protein